MMTNSEILLRVILHALGGLFIALIVHIWVDMNFYLLWFLGVLITLGIWVIVVSDDLFD